MLQKTTLGIAIVAVVLAVVSFLVPHGGVTPPLGYSGAGTTLNSIQLTPSASYNGGSDSYALGWNTMANRNYWSAATPLIDLNGAWVGPQNDNIAATLYVTTSTPTSTLSAAVICNNGLLQVNGIGAS